MPGRPGAREAIGLGGWLRRLVGLFVFAVFPVLTAQLAMRQVEDLQVEQAIGLERLRHERWLGRLSAADNEGRMVSRSILRTFDAIRPLTDLRRRTALVRRLRRLFPGAFDLYFFDRDQQVIRDLSDSRHPARATSMAFGALRTYAAGETYDRGAMGILQSMLNMPTVLMAIKAARTPVKLAERDREGFLLWDFQADTSPGHPAGFLAILHPGKFEPERALRGSIRWLNRRLRRMRTGLIDFAKRPIQPYPPAIDAVPELRSSMLRAISQYDRHFRAATVHGSFLARPTRGVIVVYSPLPRFFPWWVREAVHLASLAWLLWVGWFLLTHGERVGGRIPTKLTALFLFAIGTPSVVLLIGGYYALQDHGHVLEQKLETRIRDKLRDFDERLPAEVAKVEARVAAIIREARQLPTLAEQRRVFRRFRKIKDLDSVFVIDPAGREAFVHLPHRRANMDRQKKFMLMLGKELLARLNKSMKVDSGALMIEATEELVSTLVGGGMGSFDLELISRNMGHFMSLTLGAESSYVMFDALYNLEGRAILALVAVIHRGHFERDYIARHVRDLARQPDLPMTINAVGEASHLGRVITTPDRLATIDHLAREAWASRSSTRLRLASGTVEEFWYAHRGSNLQHFVVLAAASLEPVKQHLQLLWLLLLALAGVVILSTWFIGVLLSDQFLRPIADLTLGVRAIERREFHTRVPVHGPDELGELSALLNTVLEGMEDLAVARIVQESLFPAHPVVLQGYHIWGKSRAMTDIGGDYFDYFILPEDRLMGLVGDVSGHGVSAALVMGMAKSLFANPDNASRGIRELLLSFNRFLLAHVRAKKMMTLFLFVVETRTHTFSYANAGHNFPMVYRARYGGVQTLEQASFPVGIRARAVYDVREDRLDPGDGLLLYTDGLIESTNQAGEPVSYETARAWFTDLGPGTPHQVVEGMFQRFDAFTIGMPAADDISVICLKREPAAAS
ncbi:MAG: Serine phosphatase RsbU, regulator of sigma subunit [Candidatus Ozemobacter sibiricus]|uniref:Serine phosphatase RsbU, regulator of sigma subunit n=1 Tax=Candidatus Ozemobacter sibiricus TaxID=2268124 RepID=A0A367ZNR6_9BACT|nr:MAG: Serine phosphatase RsbU, regulator of sigma subunit [Candidatus Ozemobacter sibiricus]